MSRNILAVTVFLIIAASVFASGSKDESAQTKIVQVTGLVRLVGSSPMYEIVISGAEFQWYVVRDEMDKLFDLQHQTVTVEGEETIMELKFANGRPAGTRRELRKIKIISVQQ